MGVAMTCWLTGLWSTQAKVEVHDTVVQIAVLLTIPLENQMAPHCM